MSDICGELAEVLLVAGIVDGSPRHGVIDASKPPLVRRLDQLLQERSKVGILEQALKLRRIVEEYEEEALAGCWILAYILRCHYDSIIQRDNLTIR